MSLGLKELNSSREILPLTDFDNITDPKFVEFVKARMDRWRLFKAEYEAIKDTASIDLLKSDRATYWERKKKIDDLCRNMNEIKMDIWRAGKAILSGENPFNGSGRKVADEDDKLENIRKKVIQIKEENEELYTPRTPYLMSKEELKRWLDVATRVLDGEEVIDADKQILCDPRKERKEKIAQRKIEQSQSKKEKNVIDLGDDLEMIL